MKITYALALLAAVALTTAQAGHDGGTLFRAGETSLDLLGSVSVGQDTIDHISGNRVREEVRLTKEIGLFVDARYVFTKDVANFGQGRAGVRLVF